MKNTLLLACLLLMGFTGKSQTPDSLLTKDQTVELSISSPQPRMNETFEISIDINHMRANIFQSLQGKLHLANETEYSNKNHLTMKVNAIHKGMNEIGPLEFYLNKTKYTTNKISFEVIDALPNTDEGLWIRKVMTSDTTFCLIMEQRIPANTKVTKKSRHSIKYETLPIHSEIATLQETFAMDGLKRGNSNSSTKYGNAVINGEEKEFMVGYAIFYFEITDKNAQISFTKDQFKNLPDNYNFETIVIQ